MQLTYFTQEQARSSLVHHLNLWRHLGSLSGALVEHGSFTNKDGDEMRMIYVFTFTLEKQDGLEKRMTRYCAYVTSERVSLSVSDAIPAYQQV